MSTANFIVHEHKVAGQHIREPPNALAVDETVQDGTIYLSVKQYVPRNNPNPSPGDITIIALHAMSYNKELYEPMWDDLLASLGPDVKIRGIWMADMAQVGSSYVLNENKLAEGVVWDDHARDILHITNVFRDQMVHPMVGIGHSMGAAQLVQVCKLHPRLFTSVAMLDPWFSRNWAAPGPKGAWMRSISRKDTFQSRDTIIAAYRKAAFFKVWDPRCFDLYIATAFRDMPTMLHSQENGVALKTPSTMEHFASLRQNIDGVNTEPGSASRIDRLTVPDMRYDLPSKTPVYLPDPFAKGEFLPHLRPRVLFLYGKDGSATPPDRRELTLEETGNGAGGNGGVKLGCVEGDTIPGGHFFPFEQPTLSAQRLAEWLIQEQNIWHKEKAILDKKFGLGKPAAERQSFPQEFHQITRNWAKSSGKL